MNLSFFGVDKPSWQYRKKYSKKKFKCEKKCEMGSKKPLGKIQKCLVSLFLECHSKKIFDTKKRPEKGRFLINYYLPKILLHDRDLIRIGQLDLGCAMKVDKFARNHSLFAF